MEWLGEVLAQNAPVVVLICGVWWQLNSRLSTITERQGKVRERLVRIETKLGVVPHADEH